MALVQIQYDFFEEKPDEFAVYRLQIAAIEESTTKVRKKLFAENGALKKRVTELEERLSLLEHYICKKVTS
jgi:hypothetical protein